MRRAEGIKKMLKRSLLIVVAVLSAALLISSGAYATWGPSDLVAVGTTDTPTVAPSCTLSGGMYVYTYVLTNTTLTGVNSFYLTMPTAVEPVGASGPAGWSFSVRAGNLLDWTNHTGASIAHNATGTFSFSCKHAPSPTMTVVAACEGARMFSGSTYGPLPVAEPTYGLNNRAAYDPIISIAAAGYRFKVWGSVLITGVNSFTVNDGSGPVTVIAPGFSGIGDGDYASASGKFSGVGLGRVLNAQASDVVKL
jgi:hypothetical protein